MVTKWLICILYAYQTKRRKRWGKLDRVFGGITVINGKVNLKFCRKGENARGRLVKGLSKVESKAGQFGNNIITIIGFLCRCRNQVGKSAAENLLFWVMEEKKSLFSL